MLFLVLILILNLFFYLEKGISTLLPWVAAKHTADRTSIFVASAEIVSMPSIKHQTIQLK